MIIAKYTCNASGILPSFNTGYTNYTTNEINNADGIYTTEIAIDDVNNLPTKISFDGKSQLLSVEILNISKVTDMRNMFYDCSSLTELNISEWNTSSVTNMSGVFYNCSSLTELNISEWNTSSVTNMSNLFYGCSSLTGLHLNNWDTVNVTNMSGVFYNCSSLTELNISEWNTSSVTNMSNLFYGCSSLTELDLNNWDTSKVTSMYNMFSNCELFVKLNVSNFDTSKVTTMSSMFHGCSSLTELDLNNFDTSKVTSMYNMFSNCELLVKLNVSNFDTSKVTDMRNMFYGCSSLTELDLNSFDTSNIPDKYAIYMLFNCANLRKVKIFNTNSVGVILSQLPTKKESDKGYLFVRKEVTNTKHWECVICKDSKQTIPLPQPLNKIGDVKDKLYWDEDKGHYCMEHKFAKEEMKNITWNILNQNTEFIYFTGSRLSNVFKHSDKGLCNKLPCYQQYGLASMTKEGIAFRDSSVYIVLSKTRDILTLEQLETFIDDLFAIWELETYNIIDLPHLNKKYSLDTYLPTTYLECSNSPMQPSKMYFETDKLKYKPLALETNKDYTVQFECSKNSDTNVKVVLGGVEEEIEAVVGTNHINITTPEELSSDRLYISGQGNKVSDVMLVDGDMKQYPEYFDGIESVGELQEDGKYKIEIGTDNGVKNLVDTNPNSWKVIDGSVNIIQKTPIKVRPNTKYTAYWDSSRWLLVFKCDSDGNTSTTYVHKNTGEFEFITDDSTEYIIARMDHSDSDLNYAHSSNLRIFKGETDFGYEGYQKHRQHYNIPILLAEPLRKIGDVADRIYWDHTLEKYCIERNVGVITYTGDETWTVQTLSSDYNSVASGFYTSIENAERTTTDTSLVINDGGFICYSDAVYSYKPRAIGINRSGRLYLSLYNDEFGYDGVANSATKLSLFKEYLSSNPVTVYYSYTTPIIEEVECEGEVVNLPRLYQREETCFNVTTGNLRPSNIMLEYKNI